MKRISFLLLAIAIACLLIKCGGTQTHQQMVVAENMPIQQKIGNASDEVYHPEEITVDEMFGYRYAIPYRLGTSKTRSGAYLSTEEWNLYIYGLDNLEFIPGKDVVEQCKEEVFSALYSSTRFLASEQSATTETLLINQLGIEMVRATGELSGRTGTKPYIAYYYLTVENYIRFIIVVDYGNEPDAAEAIDFVAEWLEMA